MDDHDTAERSSTEAVALNKATVQNGKGKGKRPASPSRFKPLLVPSSSPIEVEESEEEEEIDELMSPSPEPEPEPANQPQADLPTPQKVATVPAEEVIKVIADEVAKILAEKEDQAFLPKNKKAKHDNGGGGHGQQGGKKGGPATAGSSGGASGSNASKPGKWTPREKEILFRKMLLNPAMSKFNEVGSEVGRSGQSCKIQWRKNLLPWLLKQVEESGQGGREE